MLYIIFEDGKDTGWHIGFPHPVPRYDTETGVKFTVPKITEIQADGDELEAIHRMFPYITPVGMRVANFPQPWADLIALNLFKNSRT